MPYDPHRHRRRSVRLRGYDYASNGAYAVTICTHARRPLFGRVVDGAVIRSAAGEIAQEELLNTPALRPYVLVDSFVVMPDHVHAIFVICGDAPAGACHKDKEVLLRAAPRSLATIVRGYKGAVTRRLVDGGLALPPVWQRSYYESLLRTQEQLVAMRRYIEDNPRRASDDDNQSGRRG